MVRLIVRRLLGGVLLIVLLTFSAFAVTNAIPQNKECLVADCNSTSITQTQLRAAADKAGFNRPVVVQYGDFMWHIIRNRSLGYSWNGIPLDSTIRAALPATMSLVAGGMILTVLLAMLLGALAALRPRSYLDRSLLTGSVVGLAVHPFVLGIGLAAFFHVLGAPKRNYCPLTTVAAPAEPTFPGQTRLLNVQGPLPCGGLRDWTAHLAVPWLVFALFFVPLYLRMFRTRLIETLGERYVLTARAKGATESRIVVRHALRNAVAPLLPMIALDAGTAITAAIYVETIFGLPGLGHLAVMGLSGDFFQLHYDLPFIVAIVLTIGVFVVALTTAADVASAWLDPRARGRETI